MWANSLDQWKWINVVCIIMWFIFGPLYSFKIQRYFKLLSRNPQLINNRFFKKREQSADSTDIVEVHLEEYIDAEDYIKVNERVTPVERRYRILASYIIFVLVLGVSSVATFVLVAASTSQPVQHLDSRSILLSAIIAMFMTMVNMMWQRICVWLTRLERHATWTQFRQHNTLKFFLFKMLNVLAMYASRVLVPRVSLFFL